MILLNQVIFMNSVNYFVNDEAPIQIGPHHAGYDG